jgi:simple sugar transport system permease protein
MIEVLSWFIASLAPAYIVYTLVALGNLLIERSGILNIAIDGFFVLSSAMSYTYAILLSQYLGPGALATCISVVLTALTAAIAYSIFTSISTVLPVSQGAIGLSFMFAGYGLGAIVGNIGRIVFSTHRVRTDYIGTTIESSIFAYTLTVAAVFFTHFLLYKLKLGVFIRAVGEDPRIASQVGANVVYIRFLSGLLGGSLIGLGGALFTLWRIGGWSQGQGLNHGWLAYAISIAGWRFPLLVAPVSVFFSSLYVLSPHLQSMSLPVEVSTAIPYAVSIAVMALVSILPKRGRVFADPKALGKEFFREERA